MIYLKKLLFAPFFLAGLLILLSQLSLLFKSYDFIFSLSPNSLIPLVIISTLITLISLLFALFGTFASNLKFTIPIAILSSITPFFFFEPVTAIILGVGILVILLLTSVNLDSTLKNYLSFQPSNILGPSIRHLSTFLILVISLTFFLSTNKMISENGFQIPDSLIDTALKFSPMDVEIPNLDTPSLSSIPAEQIEFLRQNPERLEQFGLDPSVLDSLDQETLKTPQNLTQGLLKQTLKGQMDTLIRPYLSMVPIILAILLFFLLQSFVSLINLLIYPLLWILFFIFEKTGFIKFNTEMRPVRNLVI